MVESINASFHDLYQQCSTQRGLEKSPLLHLSTFHFTTAAPPPPLEALYFSLPPPNPPTPPPRSNRYPNPPPHPLHAVPRCLFHVKLSLPVTVVGSGLAARCALSSLPWSCSLYFSAWGPVLLLTQLYLLSYICCHKVQRQGFSKVLYSYFFFFLSLFSFNLT